MSGHQASPEDLELEEAYKPRVGKTLEEVIVDGESEWEKEQVQERIPVSMMPQWVASVLINLKRKHHNVSSLAAVECLTAKLGIAVIRESLGESITEVKRLRKRVFELINQFLLKKTYREGSTYELEETVGTVYRKCSREILGPKVTLSERAKRAARTTEAASYFRRWEEEDVTRRKICKRSRVLRGLQEEPA